MTVLKKKLDIPSLHSYQGSINSSVADFYATTLSVADFVASKSLNFDGTPIEITSEKIRTTKSDFKGYACRFDSSDEKSVKEPNIQTREQAIFPAGFTSLVLKSSLTFIANSLSPKSCNDRAFMQKVTALTAQSAEKGAYESLAALYLNNMLNARWTWRNRDASPQRCVTLSDPYSDLSMTVKVKPRMTDDYSEHEGYAEFQQAIADALKGKRDTLVVNMLAIIETPEGHKLYPSQEMKTEKSNDSEGAILYSRKQKNVARHAGMHTQKVGNAIRTIDIWHPEYNAMYDNVVAIGTYASDTFKESAYRLPIDGTDFYTLLSNVETLTEALKGVKKAEDVDHLLYFIACLINGGVFSAGADKQKPKAKKRAQKAA